MSYWVYQHLGNLSPGRDPRPRACSHRFLELGDASPELTAWAEEAERLMAVPGGYRFSFYRELGPVRLVVIDSRVRPRPDAGRPADGRRREWAWVVEHADVDVRAPRAGDVGAGRHAGRPARHRAVERARLRGRAGDGWFSRFGETIRRAVDLEDWSAFHDSYDAMMDLVYDVATPGRRPVSGSADDRDDPLRRRALQLPVAGDPRRADRAGRSRSAASTRSSTHRSATCCRHGSAA